MKKIASIGLLLCFLAACGVTNSKFNPHLDGFYMNKIAYQSVPPPQGVYIRVIYLHIHYPYIQACSLSYLTRGTSRVSPISWLSNVHVRLVHLKGYRYKAQTINGTPVRRNITYKMKKGDLALYFKGFVNGEVYSSTPFVRYGDSPSQDYLTCINHANETRLIFQPINTIN